MLYFTDVLKVPKPNVYSLFYTMFENVIFKLFKFKYIYILNLECSLVIYTYI